MIKIDGSYGEGGGQILRTALSLSAILNKPFEIYNIRKGRKKPGLLAQHLTGVNAARLITEAKVTGDKFGSLSLTFEPKAIKGGEYEFNVAEERSSAGSVTLVAQTVLPILFFADKDSIVTFKGGTHVPFSPPFDYLKEILLPTIANLGYEAEAFLKAFGFYPVGGGEAVLKIKPRVSSIKTEINLQNRGGLKELKIVSRAANLPLSIAERQKSRLVEQLKTLLKDHSSLPISDSCEAVKASYPGTYLFLKADFENITAGFSALGAKGKPAEKVADELFEEFSDYFKQNEVADPHLADQILVFLSVSKKPFTFTTTKITNHLLTNIWVINQFLPELKIAVSNKQITLS